MSVFYSAKMVLDEALATIGGVNNPDLRARALAMTNQLVQRCASLYDFKELFVFWRGEVPKADNVDHMMPLEIPNIPADMDRLHRAWIMKRTNSQWERQPLKILATGQFMDQFMSGMFEQTPHVAPSVVSLKAMQAIRQDVTREYRLNPNALELGNLSGQDEWIQLEPRQYTGTVQNDTPIGGNRAIKWAPDAATAPTVAWVTRYQQNFETLALGDLDGQDGWVRGSAVPYTLDISNTAPYVIAGMQSAVGHNVIGPTYPFAYSKLLRPSIATKYRLTWKQTMLATDTINHANQHTRVYGTWGGPVAWQFERTDDPVLHNVMKFLTTSGGLVWSTPDPNPTVPVTVTVEDTNLSPTSGTINLTVDGALVWSGTYTTAGWGTDLGMILEGYGIGIGIWGRAGAYDDILLDEQIGIPYVPSDYRIYKHSVPAARRYQFSTRCRFNPDVAAATGSRNSLMVATTDNIPDQNRQARAVLGVDIVHSDATHASFALYYDGAVQYSATTQVVNEDCEVIVIVDDNRQVTLTVNDTVLYTGTIISAYADRLLMAGDLGVITRVAWQGLSLDMTGLTVESTVLEDSKTEAAVTVYTDPEKRTERRYSATGLGLAPKTLVATTVNGVKSFTKSNVSRGLIALKSGDGQLLAVLREGEMAAIVPVLQIGGFPDQPYPLLLHYKIRPPMLMGPGDAITHLPECAVKWVMQKLKVTLMKGREDIDWQAENDEIKRLEVEMAQVMGAEQVDRPYVDFDEGF